MKIALVHDYLIQDGGAERVLEAIQEAFPEAPLYTLLFDPKRMPRFAGKDIRPSFLARIPFACAKYQWLLPLMPTATESYDLRAYDVVLTSTSALAKGVLTREDAVHICYCHTPTRYLWSDATTYLQELRLPWPMKAFLPSFMTWLRVWDHAAAQRPDRFLANSETIVRRIRKYYGRASDVLYPAVEIERFRHVRARPRAGFLAGGRLVTYKRFDLVIDAANKTGLPLIIFGTGPEEAALKRRAKANVTFVGKVSDEELVELYAGARAFLHPQEEDFGITPVEAMAAGCPVIAYGRGGATETVVEGTTGVFFYDQTWEALADAMIRFKDDAFDPAAIRARAETFSRARFIRELKDHVERAYADTRRPAPRS